MSADILPVPDPLDGMFSADWLMAQSFPPTQYVVPGVFPEGLTLLVAAPKIGKSWMVLGLGAAAAAGSYAFGHIKVQPRPVLYLALEDGQRRLQGRLSSLEIVSPPKGLHFITQLPKHGPIPAIETFLERHQDAAPLVILDTLGKVMPPAYANETTYQRDYRVAGALKAAVDAVPGASLIGVHHTRKAASDDFLDSVSGTQGIAGAADTIAVLKRDREATGAILQVTSRDAREGSYALTLDETGAWELDGTTLEEAAHAATTGQLTAGVGDPMAQLIALVNRSPEGITARSVAEALHWEDGKTRMYLKRAHDAGRIARPKRGLYCPPVTSVASVTSLPFKSNTSNASDSPT